MLTTLLAAFGLGLTPQISPPALISVAVRRRHTDLKFGLDNFVWTTRTQGPFLRLTKGAQTAQLLGNTGTIDTYAWSNGKRYARLVGQGYWRSLTRPQAPGREVTYTLFLSRWDTGTHTGLNLTVRDALTGATLFASGSRDATCGPVNPVLLNKGANWSGVDITVVR